MLACARARIKRAGWRNITLVHSDIESYGFPENANGIISTGVFGYLQNLDEVIASAARALVPGGRLVVRDAKQSNRMPSWLSSVILSLSQTFEVTPEYFEKRAWELFEKYFQECTFEEMYLGMVYIASGRIPARAA